MAENEGNITLMEHPILWRNFEGRETKFTAAGTRTFCVVLAEDEAQKLAADRWNVKFKEPNADMDGAEGFYFLQVKVGYQGYKPPVIVMITSKGRTVMTENMVSILDALDILKIDMVIRPYDHNSGMGTGRSAYLKTAYVTIDEDPLMQMYGFEMSGPIVEDVPHSEEPF